MDDFTKKLNFESDTFSDMKRDMTFVLQRLLSNMQEKGSTEGSMALKIEVELVNEYIPNYDVSIEGESRRISKPKFKHKVTSAVQIKDEKSGNMDTEMELVYDEEIGEYVMKPVANTEQRTIFDDDFVDNIVNQNGEDEQEEEKDKRPPELPGSGAIPQLPGATEEGVIDADYREVTDQNEDATEEEPDPDDESVEDVTDDLLDGDGEQDDDDLDDYDYEEPEDE